MKKRKSVKIIFTIGLLLVLAALGLAFYNFWDASRAEKQALATEKAMESRLEKTNISFWEGPDQGADGEGGLVDGEWKEMPTLEIDGELYIGTIEVPSLGLKLPVISDWDDSKLKKSPCRFSGNYYTDDMVLCGHNYRGDTHFGALKKISEDADVYFTTVNGEIIHYKVTRGEVLGPDDLDQMTTRTDWDLTLYTCTSAGRERLTVRCRRVP